MTGFMAPMGTGVKDATEWLVEEINAEGGVNGHPLEVVMYDDESDPSKGVLALKKLVEEDEVLGVMGPLSTGIAIACASVAEEEQVPMYPHHTKHKHEYCQSFYSPSLLQISLV